MNKPYGFYPFLFLVYVLLTTPAMLAAQCGVGQTLSSYCYANDEVNNVAFEVCPSAGMAAQATISQGTFYGSDNLTVYEGTTGSGTSGTIYFGPQTGNLAGNVITGGLADNCLIFVINSNMVISCDDGFELELQVCGESITAGTVQFTAPTELCMSGGVQAGLGGGLPAGGVYSGSGVTDDGNGLTYTFDPTIPGVGMNTLTYTFSATPMTSDVEIFSAPSVSYTAPANLCVDAGTQTGLGGGTPTGGVYSGPGVTDDGNGMTYTFNPGLAGLGIHTITYTESSVCKITDTDNIEVLAACGCVGGIGSFFHCYDDNESSLVIFEICPSAGMAVEATINEGIFTSYVDNLRVYQGTSGSATSGDIVFGPASGDLSGTTITGNIADNCLIFVSTTDGILSSKDGSATALSVCGADVATSVIFTAPEDLCVDAGLQSTLGGGSPTGGVYSGAGVTDDGNGMTYSFNPATAGTGVHTITYTHGFGTTMDNIEVLALPGVSFTALADLCIDEGVQMGLGGGTPIGGTYSGLGVTDDGNGMTYSFDPKVAGLGVHAITYTDGDCSVMGMDNAEVLAACGCPSGDVSYFNCYGNGETDLVIFEVCPSAGMFAEAVINEGTYGLGDLLTVYQGTTGSGTGGAIVFGPMTGNLSGTTINASTADECLIFVSNSDPVISCADGFELALKVCGNSKTSNVTFTALDDLSSNAGVQTGLTGGSPTGGVYSGSGVTDDGNGMTYTFNPATAGVGTHTLTYTTGGGSATDDVEVMNLLPPSFSKSFDAVEIGMGSVATLTFTIDNTSSGTPATALAFVDNLPAGVTIADPPNIVDNCTGGTLTAVAGGTSITYSGGSIVGSSFCTLSVDVTSSTVGTHTNITGDLTSSAGNSGTASANLTVKTDRPGFTKSFSPASINLGERSTLTFTVDNSVNAVDMVTLNFTDNLPTGMVVASPANFTTSCGGSGTITAEPGTDVISYTAILDFAATAVAAGATCTYTVDVIGMSAGDLINESGSLSGYNKSFAFISGTGKATAKLEVVVPGEILIQKSFTTNPAVPGSSTNLEYTLTNMSRDYASTDIAFTDDLTTVLAGLTATGTPLTNICGAGSQLSGTTALSFTGGSISAGGSCTFSVPLSVPGGAASGQYSSTSSAVNATFNGGTIIGNTATEELVIANVPTITKTFLNDPIPAGGTTTIEFEITNTSTTSALTDLTFTDNLSAFISGTSISSLPAANSCGTGSIFTSSLVSDELVFQMTGGNIAAGSSCTFSIDIVISNGVPAASYTNTTSMMSGTVDGGTVASVAASDDLTVLAVPKLSKSFANDPVNAGDIVNLEFTLTYDDFAAGDATNISFTDDLNAVIAGMAAVGLPLNDVCGMGSQVSGTSTITFTGGSLSPGGTCTFSVPVQVPAGTVPGTYTNTTGTLSATVGGQAASNAAATDDLNVGGVSLTKEFIDDPVIPGDLVTMRYTIDNTSAFDASSIVFTDNLSAVISGLAAEAPLPSMPCGATTFSGTTFMIFAGATVSAGTSCSFDVMVRVPVSASSGTFSSSTSNLTAIIDGAARTLDVATDNLKVENSKIQLTKSFTDDPVEPGSTVTLEYTLTNLDATNALSNVAFTDDFDGLLSGLAATGLPMTNICGAGSQASGTTSLSFTGGNLAAGGTCTFSVTLQTPVAAAHGSSHTSTTSALTGTMNTFAVVGDATSDDLVFQSLQFSKSFLGPVTAGTEATLRYTITNADPDDLITGITFTDDLDAFISGMEATNLPQDDICGTGSRVSGTSVIILGRGELTSGQMSTFDVTVLVPCDAPGGTTTSTSDKIEALGLIGGEAAADLTVTAAPVATFTAPGDTPLNGGTQTMVSGGSPAQGTAPGDAGVYSGPGVTDDGNGMTYTFDPSAAGLGVHTITYTYTDENGCVTMATDDIEVTAPVPVELLGFKATATKTVIHLDWTTVTEINNEGFELQRSTNPTKGFTMLSWINGKGNSLATNNYSFVDREVEAGEQYYYRLKQVDFDRTASYSPIVSAKIAQDTWGMKIVPNPAKDQTAILIDKPQDEPLRLQLMGIDGTIWMEEILSAEQSRLNLSLIDIPSGIYFIQLKGETVFLLDRFVKNQINRLSAL